VLDQGREHHRAFEQIHVEVFTGVEAGEDRREVGRASCGGIGLRFRLGHRREGKRYPAARVASRVELRLGQSLQDLAAESMIRLRLVKRLLEEADLRLPVVARPGIGEHEQGVRTPGSVFGR
jgi:hypothetical protein